MEVLTKINYLISYNSKQNIRQIKKNDKILLMKHINLFQYLEDIKS